MMFPSFRSVASRPRLVLWVLNSRSRSQSGSYTSICSSISISSGSCTASGTLQNPRYASSSSGDASLRRRHQSKNNNNRNGGGGGASGGRFVDDGYGGEDAAHDDEYDEKSKQQQGQQPFVKTRLDAGEWDPERKDPLYRPKFQSTAKILHADDFARRPKVGFTGEFENFHDAMVTVSHLGQKQQDEVYDAYVNFMLSTDHHAAGRTSHEYVYRVLGQKFKMTTERIAGIVLLRHNEERMKDEGLRLHNETADIMDDKFNTIIAEAYQCTGERPPAEFAEDPVGVDGSLAPRKLFHVVPDLADLDRLAEEMTVREASRARLLIDGHLYKEDIDDDAIVLPMDRATRQLLRQKARLVQQMADDPIVSGQRQRAAAVEPQWPKISHNKGKGVGQRPRFRYVAQIVDTRVRNQEKYVNDSPKNTIVEIDDELRPGTLEDCKTVSWKPHRESLEHLIAPMRKAWLDRTVRHQVHAWGKSHVVHAVVDDDTNNAVNAASDDVTDVVTAMVEQLVNDDNEDGDNKDNAGGGGGDEESGTEVPDEKDTNTKDGDGDEETKK